MILVIDLTEVFFPVVDVGAPHDAAALDEVVRVQSARVLDPGLQHPQIALVAGIEEAAEHGPLADFVLPPNDPFFPEILGLNSIGY